MLGTVLFIALLLAGFCWMFYSAWMAPFLCDCCGADTTEDVKHYRERCSNCGEEFH